MLSAQKLCHGILFLFVVNSSTAQEKWPSPEVEQMFRHGKEYVAAGNLKDAIITFKNAISLAPDKMVLYREMGNAYYLSGQFSEAVKAITRLTSLPEADEQCYFILAASQHAQHNIKEAKATINSGIERFPNSGLLYHEKGIIIRILNKPESALEAWLEGIRRDPGYAMNYYEAAEIYYYSDNVLWGLLYGEIYLNITHDTVGNQEFKKQLFVAYKSLFDNIVKEVPEFGKAKMKSPVKSFEDAVLDVYASLTPVVSDGITTENLTMVRARFLIDWFSKYHSKYPFTLFSYLGFLLKTGHFEMYNQWLFGKADSDAEFASWNNFHEGDLDRFALWRQVNQIHPVTQDFYNN